MAGEIEEEPTIHQFAVITDHSDHHYATRRTQITAFSNGSSQVHKAIMKEWKILEKDLPETIYVRVYESQIDLMRAVIVGPPGTPYHDGLFFFDIAFPANYPNTPPLVYYHSFGLRLNPNLYKSGYVCLSLLNTWNGRKSEKWNPNESTVLQVLVSLQCVVLNEKPYFNEPGIEGKGFWISQGMLMKRSLAYSENVFILSCKTMLYLLRRPPKNLEGLISRHFRERGTHILTACDDYINGRARVGLVDEKNVHGLVKASKTFKTTLLMLFDELVVEFSKNGTSLEYLIEQTKKQRELETESAIEIKEEETVLRKIVEKSKEILGVLGLTKELIFERTKGK